VALLRLPGVPPPRPASFLTTKAPFPIREGGSPGKALHSIAGPTPGKVLPQKGGWRLSEARSAGEASPALLLWLAWHCLVIRIPPLSHKVGIRLPISRSQFFLVCDQRIQSLEGYMFDRLNDCTYPFVLFVVDSRRKPNHPSYMTVSPLPRRYRLYK
jgi:hypothetical protein